jgi:hypothetical protein
MGFGDSASRAGVAPDRGFPLHDCDGYRLDRRQRRGPADGFLQASLSREGALNWAARLFSQGPKVVPAEGLQSGWRRPAPNR